MALTDAQALVFKAALLAETDPELVGYRTNGQTTRISDWYNKPSAFVVYKTSVPSETVGAAFDAASLDAMTAGNADKLANFRAWNAEVFPARADHRVFFSGVFSVASGALTRSNLDALWRRFATRAEQLFATGTGTTLAPGALVFEGDITDTDVSAALS